MKTLKEFENTIVYKLHRRVSSNTMIHYVSDGPDFKTLCGIEVEHPIQDIDPYDGSSVVDKGGMIVTGFYSPLHYDQCVKPTCAECSRLYQQKRYYCTVHGFLSGKEVTFEEKCDYCGNSV